MSLENSISIIRLMIITYTVIGNTDTAEMLQMAISLLEGAKLHNRAKIMQDLKLLLMQCESMPGPSWVEDAEALQYAINYLEANNE